LIATPRTGSSAEAIDQAVALARVAVAAAPQNGSCWTTLGVAQYRAGAWEWAIKALEHAEDLLKSDEFGRYGFFLAMAHGRLGHAELARDYYDRSVAWRERYAPADPELLRFRAEAEALLRLAKRHDVFPTDPFAH
jgi:uncharacterized protein HemY